MFIELPPVEKESLVRTRIKLSRVEMVEYMRYSYQGADHHLLNILMKSGKQVVAAFGTNAEEAVKLFVKITEEYD